MFTESPFQVCWYHAGWLESGTRGTHRLLGCHCRIGGLSKSEWSIGISIERAGFNRNLLDKSAQNRFQNDAVAVDQWTGHRCLRSQWALDHTRRTFGSRGALLAALRDRTEIMQGETGCYFANRFIFCYQIFGRLFIYQGQGLAPHDISVLNGGNGEQSQD